MQLPMVAPAAGSRWCGSEATSDDRSDAVLGAQVHVVYAIPADAPDRFFAVAPLIVADLAAVDRWWQGQDPGRAPRFDLFAAPGCEVGLGQLDLTFVRLNGNSAYYGRPTSESIFRLMSELPRQPSHKKRLTLYDGVFEVPELCGLGGGDPTRGGDFLGAIVFLRSLCGHDLGSGGVLAATAAHELLHTFGAVPEEAPHLCLGGHVCDSENDLMAPSPQPLAGLSLDSGRDDYYGHAEKWFDTQDSQWLRNLAAPQVSLTVSGAADALGHITSEPPGIDCPPSCSVPWDSGTRLRLFAAPEGRSRFAGWGGACSGHEYCTILMNQPVAVSARFVRQVELAVNVVKRGGAGVVRGLLHEPCSRQCLVELDEGTSVRLVAKAGPRSRFLGWSGRCSGRRACTFRLGADSRVDAVFGSAKR